MRISDTIVHSDPISFFSNSGGPKAPPAYLGARRVAVRGLGGGGISRPYLGPTGRVAARDLG